MTPDNTPHFENGGPSENELDIQIEKIISSDLKETPGTSYKQITDGFNDFLSNPKTKAVLIILSMTLLLSSCSNNKVISYSEINPKPNYVDTTIGYSVPLSMDEMRKIQFTFPNQALNIDNVSVSETKQEKKIKEIIRVPTQKLIILNTNPYGYDYPPEECNTQNGCIWTKSKKFTLSKDYLPEPMKEISTEEYLRIISYFNVENPENERYQKYGTRQKPYTWCNVYVSDVTKALGVEIPRFTMDYKTGKVSEFSAAHQYNWLQKEGKFLGWFEIDSETAKEYADKGFPTVVSHPDHIALVIPGDGSYYEGVLYPLISQAGWYNYKSIDLPRAFERFFYPELQEEPFNLKDDIEKASERRQKVKFFTNTGQYTFVSEREASDQFGVGYYQAVPYSEIVPKDAEKPEENKISY